MFSSISRYIWGSSDAVIQPNSQVVIESFNNDDENFDTRSEEGEWVLVVTGQELLNAAMSLRTSECVLKRSQSTPEIQEIIQSMPIGRSGGASKRSKNKKAAKELGKSHSGNDKASLAGKIFPGVLPLNRYSAAKVSENKAFRNNKKSMERNNKAMMVASSQKPQLFNFNLRFNNKRSQNY